MIKRTKRHLASLLSGVLPRDVGSIVLDYAYDANVVFRGEEYVVDEETPVSILRKVLEEEGLDDPRFWVLDEEKLFYDNESIADRKGLCTVWERASNLTLLHILTEDERRLMLSDNVIDMLRDDTRHTYIDSALYSDRRRFGKSPNEEFFEAVHRTRMLFIGPEPISDNTYQIHLQNKCVKCCWKLINARSEWSVEILKRRICARFCIPFHHAVILHKDRVLEGQGRLCDHNIQDRTVLWIELRRLLAL